MMPVIKVGMNVAYDWVLLKRSLPRLYEKADIIVLSIDKYRKSWDGTSYNFDEIDFQKFISSVDVCGKIQIVEDVFSDTRYSTIENDNRQRARMAQALGQGGWHIQVDADEYFIDFSGFVEYLQALITSPTGNEKPINICAYWISLLKRVDEGFLYVKNSPNNYETNPFATNVPIYLNARRNGHFDHLSPFFVLHETWARGEDELLRKLKSWSHNSDIRKKDSYFKLWKALDKDNCRFIKDFHPIGTGIWESLSFMEQTNIDHLITYLEKFPPRLPSKVHRFIRNSRIIQAVK